MLRHILLAALLLACLPGPVTAQSDEEQAREALQQLQGDIKRINREISSAQSRRDRLRQQLRDAELALAQLQKDMADNRRAIASAEEELVSLEQQRQELENARVEQQALITRELRAAWQTGNQGQLKILLNQESPHTVARALAYYRYFFEARNERINHYRETLARLDQVQRQIDATTTRLREENRTLAKRSEQLAGAQQNREQAVASLNASINSKSDQLQQLERDRAKLEQLLRAIEEAVINLKLPESSQAFADAKGKMPWPVKGKPGNRYGRPRNEGKMRWQGLQIPAREGTVVKAIHHGRVVYADWFRGSGLLLIIDHGDGYMSLYAHNQTLLREVGEWVSGGNPVSTVGSSGGLERPALYFEIRKDGKPTNPGPWCSD